MEVLQISKISIAWEMYSFGVSIDEISEQLHVHRATVYRWISGIRKSDDLEIYLDSYISSKKGPRAKRKVNSTLKKNVFKIREENNDCCGQKIKYFLKEDYGINVSVTTIYKILREKYQLRSKWKKNVSRGPVPKAKKPREVVQMDTVDFGKVFAFTSVDIFSKEADVLLRPSLEAKDGQVFLHTTMGRRYDKHTDLIQTDGGSEFKAEFKKDVTSYCNRHRVARAYKKNEQSFIESFNRSLRKECLGWSKYKRHQIQDLTTEVNNWLVYYHYTRPHIGLGMRPPLKRNVSHI